MLRGAKRGWWFAGSLATILLLSGCSDKTHREAAKQGWNLAALHEHPAQLFVVTAYGTDYGSLRVEIQHQMYQGREVIVQREHSKGIRSGMTETVFDAVSFLPIYQQSYEDSAGQLREDRLEYDDGQVRFTRTESFFGDDSETKTIPLSGTVYDERQLLTLLRAATVEPGSVFTWNFFSRSHGEQGEASISIRKGKADGELIAQVDFFGGRQLVTLSDPGGQIVKKVEGPDGFGLQSVE